MLRAEYSGHFKTFQEDPSQLWTYDNLGRFAVKCRAVRPDVNITDFYAKLFHVTRATCAFFGNRNI